MVDVFIDSITTGKLIVRSAIVEEHTQRITLSIKDNVAIGIASDRTRSILTARLCSSCRIVTIKGIAAVISKVTGMVVAITVNAQIAETIDGVKSVTYLHATEVVFIGIVVVAIDTCQHAGIH